MILRDMLSLKFQDLVKTSSKCEHCWGIQQGMRVRNDQMILGS